MTPDAASADLLSLTGDIVRAHVASNRVAVADLPGLIQAVHAALAGLRADPQSEVEAAPPPARAVSIRASLADPAAIISMIDGKPYTLLTRHIGRHGYPPTRYREVFGLPIDYPMVAPASRARRREIAREIGLGRKRAPETTPVVVVNANKAEAFTPARKQLRPKY